MRESKIEQHLTRLVKRAGGRCYKWVSPGNTGVPDRIVFLRGMCFLVETKSPVGKLSAQQRVQHRELAKLGFDVVVLNSKAAVEEWVAMQVHALEPKVKTSIRCANVEFFFEDGACVEARDIRP